MQTVVLNFQWCPKLPSEFNTRPKNIQDNFTLLWSPVNIYIYNTFHLSAT